MVTGLQPVREAIRVHGERLDRVLVDQDAGAHADAVARFASDRGARVERVSRADLDRIAKGARHQGAIAFAPDLNMISIDELAQRVTKGDAILIALDELEDPQNFGAVIRSAVALGASAIVWPEHHAAPLSPATFRASAGAIEHATLCRVPSLPNALDALREAGAVVVGLDANADEELASIALREGGAPPAATHSVVLVVGAEGKGLRRPVKRACTSLAKLPMRGPIDSLNASVAAGIALYEILRRR